MFLTKLDMVIIKSTSVKEHDGAKLHQEVKCYLHQNTCRILEERIDYRFLANLTAISRRWLDLKFIKKDQKWKYKERKIIIECK